jgi:predicted ester cyclase
MDMDAQDDGRSAVRAVMAFLDGGRRKDFSSTKALLDENVTRIGPDGDVKSGRDQYLAYLEGVLGDARDYHYEVRRCVATHDGLTVLVEIDERLTQADGTEVAVSEAMVFDLTPAGRIRHLSVYTKL